MATVLENAVDVVVTARAIARSAEADSKCTGRRCCLQDARMRGIGVIGEERSQVRHKNGNCQ
jgi:hypothetical protein